MIRVFKRLSVLFVVGAFSCHSGRAGKGTVDELINFSDDIYDSYMKFKPVHEKLMYSLEDVAGSTLAGSGRRVDTGSLRGLLNKARAASQSSLDLIKDIDEVDSSIRLKTVLTAYLNAAQHFYDSDYDKLISLTVTPRKADSLATLADVRRGVHALEDRNEDLVVGLKAFKVKYQIETAFVPPGAAVRLPDLWGEGGLKVDTFNFPLRQVKIAHDEDDEILILPFTRLLSSDSEKTYTVLGTYKGKKIGFTVRMSMKGAKGFIMISTGESSDNFLNLFENVYKIERDKMSHFARVVNADCLFMGPVVDLAGGDSGGKKGMIDGYKVFFESDDPKWGAECYFNISDKDHWIELMEEPDYREKMLRDFSNRN